MGKARVQSGEGAGARPFRAAAVAAIVVALAATCWCSPAETKGSAARAGEYELKAAFVFNILSFVDWPAEAVRERLVVGFAGEGPMEPALREFLKGQQVGASRIELRVVHGASELRVCNAVFLAYPDEARMREALGHLQGQSVLTIGDGEGFVRMGGMVGLAAEGNRLGLLVNPDAAQRARLHISAKLLTMAKLIRDRAGEN